VNTIDTVMELFTEFTRLRQTGNDRDEAWLQIEERTSDLPSQSLSRLMGLLRAWEAREGKKYNPKRQNDPYATQNKPPEGLKEQMGNQAPHKKNVIRRIKPPDEQALRQAGVECPACGRMNAPGDVHCYGCGEMLQSAGSTKRIAQNELVDANEASDAYFDDNMLLYLHVRGAKHMIRVRPHQNEMILGRTSPDSAMIPDIDLSEYSAKEAGVSRLHAGLRRQDNTLVIIDLGSMNHTYINGQRLHAHEVRVLHDGDELRLAQLQMRIYFRMK
jgi:hypothetical protein